MELHCVRSDILNTDMLDSRNQPLYRISTSSSFTSSGTSTISRMVPNQYGQLDPVVIAQVEWHSWSQPVFRFRGITIKADNYINSKGFWTRTRSFTSASGKSYAWDNNVLNAQGGYEVARYHNKSYGYVGHAHPAYFQVSQEAVQDLDEIVMTLVYAQGKIQENNSAGFYGAIAGGGVAAGS
ncbi:hypothetical protein OF83DRAFT_370069 [Amylostereum chailletii]|nr:hypothetical protein OF83DRAFT_370069 [Amylostereum chailletii]